MNDTTNEGRGRTHHGGHGRPGRGGRGFGRPGGWQQADLPSASDAAAWLTGRLPDDLYAGAPDVRVDREEIVVIGALDAPDIDKNADAGAREAAIAGRITRFREDTRERRMAIASEAQGRYGRTVSWGARIGEHQVMFTNLAVPVMTRLRQDERQVLDTLVDAGVARSRADALSWAVKLVGEHTGEWLADLRTAMSDVDDLRAKGPQV